MMSRRTLLQAVALAGLTAGCTRGAPGDGASDAGTGPLGDVVTPDPSATFVRLELARAPAGGDPTVASALVGSFAGALLGEALESAQGNAVLSPWAITLALAANRAGAAGRTAEQIDRALHVPAGRPEGLHQALNAAARLLDSRSDRIISGERTGDVLLRSVSSMWASRELTWRRPYLETLATFYGAGVRLADFATDPDAARLAINAWVSDHTEGTIPQLVPDDAIGPDTLVTLATVLHLRAPWAEAFEDLGTGTRDFTLSNGAVKRSLMMQTVFETASSQQGAGWQAVTLPYLGGHLAFTAVLPDRGQESEVLGWLVGDGITELLAAGRRPRVDLTMPKFRFDTALDLGKVLPGLGVRDAFDPDEADYGAMCEDDSVHVTSALHRARISVDEEGTGAAAAAAVVGGRGGDGPEPVVVVLDRPFFVVIHDLETRVPLLVGRVADPTAAS